MMSKIDFINTIGAKPLTGASPVGQGCHELSEYVIVCNEIQKLSRIGQSSSIDWLSIIDNSVNLLTLHSKDIQIASYLAYSLFRQYHMQGLAPGLKLLLDLIANFWEELHPQGREKAKIEFLNWYATQSLNYLTQLSFVKGDEKFQKQVLTTIEKLESEMVKRGLETEFFSSFRKKLELFYTSPTVQEMPVTEEKTAKLSTETESGQANESSINIASSLLTLTKSARELMLREPSNAYSYYLNRIAAWSGIAELPFNDEGLTLVNSPEFFNRERIKKAQDAGYPSDIVATAEEIIAQEPFWLDLHFISLNALRKLDVKFNQAQEVVKGELIHFLRRFPSIETLRFNDGTLFLSEQYAEQLSTFTTAKAPSFTANLASLSDLEQKQIKQIKEVTSALAKKKQKAEISQLELFNKDSISDKVKLLSYMAISDSLLCDDEQAVLKPYLGFIIELIERHELITWEPSLALEALVLVYRGMRFLKDKISTQQLDQVFSLITKIDMNVAKELATSQGY